MEDTAYLAGNDILLGYLSFYNSAQQSAKLGVDGGKTLVENLGRFFPRNRRTTLVAPV